LDKIKSDLKGGSARDQAIKWVDAVLDKSVPGLEIEYEKLKKETKPGDTKAFNDNPDRNLDQVVIEKRIRNDFSFYSLFCASFCSI
uniref:ABC transporter substrate-binding protein n=1 Tax=Gongylonema pulchrum TaxID=637853 RepID=A0A183ETH8_9BILA